MFKLDVLSLQKRTLDEMYIKLIIQTGREYIKLPQELERHGIYQTYLEPPMDSILVKNIENLFFLNKSRHHRILVVGRPGIGKTVLTKKILHRWITSGDKCLYEMQECGIMNLLLAKLTVEEMIGVLFRIFILQQLTAQVCFDFLVM